MTAGDYWPNPELNSHNFSILKNITGIPWLYVPAAVFVKVTMSYEKTWQRSQRVYGSYIKIGGILAAKGQCPISVSAAAVNPLSFRLLALIRYTARTASRVKSRFSQEDSSANSRFYSKTNGRCLDSSESIKRPFQRPLRKGWRSR